ncbi:MAG: hypothetical protein H6605_09725 [Flavobacteriales bacterium]|nr:hypothetical protein [Flavobacteriales bacterium]
MKFTRNQWIKIIVLIVFVAGFIVAWTYFYDNIVKENKFKQEDFRNAR